MRCKNCDYPLWNLPARKCPECGTDFKPSDFHFVPNSVKFHCPHCEQQYYGTTEHGHLMPRTFNCVKCAQRIDMDEMLLFPGDGVTESRTAADVMPWLQRKQFGYVKSLLRTMFMAMTSPRRLMKAIPTNAGVGDATLFTLITQALIAFCGLGLPFLVIGLTILMNGNRQGTEMIIVSGVCMLIGSIGILVLALVWTLLTHFLLSISGGVPHDMRRTAQAILYASSGNLLLAVPCIGAYCGIYFIWVWWMVSAILMVMEGQRVKGLRATLCVGAGPALAIAMSASLITFIAMMTSRMATTFQGAPIPAGTFAPTNEAAIISAGMLAFAQQHNGIGPAHGVELVTIGQLPAASFALWQIGHDEKNVMLPGANVTLDALQYLPTNRRNMAAQNVAKSLPANVIAHRLGDVVFTHHGMNLSNADPGLWIAVICPDPDQTATAPTPGAPMRAVTPVAVLADGSIVMLTPSTGSMLPAQNALRATSGLPPLPDPSTIRNNTPAVDAKANATSMPSP